MKRVYFLAALFCLFLSGCSEITVNLSGTPTTGSGTGTNTNVSTTVPKWGTRAKTSGCVANGALQDQQCTPGALITSATKDQICKSGYSSSVRNVPTSVKNQVYAEYSIQSHSTGQYEVDHLVSLELGGSNDISNLWPEAASPKPGFHEKDKVENYLHDQVCSGAVSLQQAQVEVATNWLDVYNKMPSASQSSGNGGGQP
ncbi:MAG TPA: HNH endonuclease signature motif containing protein [Ktedonobacteraceae bacterium]